MKREQWRAYHNTYCRFHVTIYFCVLVYCTLWLNFFQIVLYVCVHLLHGLHELPWAAAWLLSASCQSTSIGAKAALCRRLNYWLQTPIQSDRASHPNSPLPRRGPSVMTSLLTAKVARIVRIIWSSGSWIICSTSTRRQGECRLRQVLQGRSCKIHETARLLIKSKTSRMTDSEQPTRVTPQGRQATTEQQVTDPQQIHNW